MTRSLRLTLGCLFVFGCGRSAPEPVAVAVVADPVAVTAPATNPPGFEASNVCPSAPPTLTVEQNPIAPPTNPVVAPASAPFALPDDDAGKAVAKALAVTLPASPVLPATKDPKARASDLDRAEFPPAPAVLTPGPTPLPASKRVVVTPPPEPVPAGIGVGTEAAVSGLKMADRPPLPRAAAVPPPSAVDVPRMVGGPSPSRAPLDDPTADLSAARVVQTPLIVVDVPAWFARVGIPDPFEFAAHLRGKLPVEGELGTTPASVPTAKP